MNYYPENTQLFVAMCDIFESKPDMSSRMIRGGTHFRTNKPVSHHFRPYDPNTDSPLGDAPYVEDIVWSAEDRQRRAEAEGGN
jgi:hypothetical protein